MLETVHETGSVYVCDSRVNCCNWILMGGHFNVVVVCSLSGINVIIISEHCVTRH